MSYLYTYLYTYHVYNICVTYKYIIYDVYINFCPSTKDFIYIYLMIYIMFVHWNLEPSDEAHFNIMHTW